MKFNSLLLAAAGVLALATASVISPQARAVAGPTPEQCDHYCHQPWLQCVAEHGGTEEAKHLCNCHLFSNGNLYCRHAGCVEAPQNCPNAAELDVTAPAPASITARDCVKLSEDCLWWTDIDHKIDDRSEDPRSEDSRRSEDLRRSEDPRSEDPRSEDPRSEDPLSENHRSGDPRYANSDNITPHCIICKAAARLCKEMCKGDVECEKRCSPWNERSGCADCDPDPGM